MVTASRDRSLPNIPLEKCVNELAFEWAYSELLWQKLSRLDQDSPPSRLKRRCTSTTCAGSLVHVPPLEAAKIVGDDWGARLAFEGEVVLG